MSNNINSKAYWDDRFSSGDWVAKRGRSQTECFTKGIIPHLQISPDFTGTILDFGCALGDSMPTYKANYPKAKLVGFDISQSAIDLCKERFGTVASFQQGEYDSIPEVDVIISSNVFEHMTDDRKIAKFLYSKCKTLYIIVPYKESPIISEHVNSYDENYFLDLGNFGYKVFSCIGWSQFGVRSLWYQIYFKNIFRFLLGKALHNRNMQIIFHFTK